MKTVLMTFSMILASSACLAGELKDYSIALNEKFDQEKCKTSICTLIKKTKGDCVHYFERFGVISAKMSDVVAEKVSTRTCVLSVEKARTFRPVTDR